MSRDDLFAQIAELRRRGEPAAVATVIGTRGSTPGRSAMRMLIRRDGTTSGTVGGGSMEDEVRRMGLDVLAREVCARRSFELTTEAVDDSELICGGTVEVFVEPLTIPTCYLFGAGHLAKAIATVAATAEFRIVVADDRDTHANQARFPNAHQVIAAPFEELLTDLPGRFNEASYVVLVTRSHQLDEQCAAACLPSKARYVGMIGSKGKVRRCHDYLREQGLSQETIARLRAPVGLDVGATSHGEIAVSIVAELIRERRVGSHDGPVRTKSLTPGT